MPYVTSLTSFVVRLLISSSTLYGNFTKSAVIASTDATTLILRILPRLLASPSAPVARSSPTIANACHTRSYHPLCFNSSSTIREASRHIRSFSSVTFPITRAPRPGPGKGCRFIINCGIPSSFATSLTSSLYRSLIGTLYSYPGI